MKSRFHYVEPGKIVSAADMARKLGVELTPPYMSAISQALDLADSAQEFFCGVFPLQSPSRLWGDGCWLPWATDYFPWVASPASRERQIRAEVEHIAASLAPVSDDADPSFWWPPSYFWSSVPDTDKGLLQGVAVDTLLAAEQYFRVLRKIGPSEAASWMSPIYVGIIECTTLAHTTLIDRVGEANRSVVRELELRGGLRPWHSSVDGRL